MYITIHKIEIQSHTPPHAHTHRKSLPHISFFVFSVVGDLLYSFQAPGFLLHPIISADHLSEDTRIQLLISVRLLSY